MEFEISRNCEDNASLSSCGNNLSDIPIVQPDFTYDQFFTRFLLPNTPCIIKNVTCKWESAQFWVKDNKPNFEYLQEKYGQQNVTVYNCSERYYNSQKTQDTVFDDYVKYWQTFTPETLPLNYLKDWHLKNTCKDDNFYNVPIYFASDWLNEYFLACSDDDYRFVYMGPTNTWTPFHADVFTSYSWSANVCGRKRWILFPPGEENNLRDQLNNLPYDVTKIQHNRKCYELIQNAGDAIFVPSGWHHQVWNLDHTISVNHNWVNGCNVKTMFLSIEANLKAVENEISDCKDMDDFQEHCQVMLNASFGLSYYKFYEFIKYIGLSRIGMIRDGKDRKLFHGHTLGVNHAFFDLGAIRKVLEIFNETDVVNNLNYFKEVEVTPACLLNEIVRILDNI